MIVEPVVLEGTHVRLEPMTPAHADGLVAAARDGELWTIRVTNVPPPDGMAAEIDDALAAAARGEQLPLVTIDRTSGAVIGSTRFRAIDVVDRRVEIGSTWLAASRQRTAANTEAKLLMLTHAFETWGCERVEFLTDALNERSRTAIARLGARQEGILRRHKLMPDGRQRDSVIFSIVRDEWPDVRARLTGRLAER